MESFVIRAKEIYGTAFRECISLKEIPAAETGQAAGASEGEILGTWNGVKMVAEGMEMNLSDFGMIMQITINADGTGLLDEGEGAETISWTSENGTVSIQYHEERL